MLTKWKMKQDKKNRSTYRETEELLEKNRTMFYLDTVVVLGCRNRLFEEKMVLEWWLIGF